MHAKGPKNFAFSFPFCGPFAPAFRFRGGAELTERLEHAIISRIIL